MTKERINLTQQIVNETDEDLLVLVYGAPPQRGPADLFDSAV